ncbi:beta-lactamase family protein [Sphingomonas sp. SM33]|uniref:Beta-lactamase family protein n=1 Tax=Sphingomonas telluris TaxID=2907998 RepID=A0ABS9VNT6_9SPHN|nr:serine hydrolase domain-containing protein [Sphingomonas telluris]MCH8616628.1 beta-lactamase family protein [Sphingomonas telluris]
MTDVLTEEMSLQPGSRGAARVDPAELDKLLDPFDRTGQPGFAVGVSLGGVPLYRRGVGTASVELPIALSPQIRMRIGSTTKQFCALAIMLLAEDGQLSIEDTPRKYVPELPDWADEFTIRQLLSHTSGMRDSFDLLFQTCGPGIVTPPDTPLKMLLDFDDLNYTPGASWRYNNSGYVLLSEIVERVSGQTFGDFLRTRILEPVGMYQSLLRPLDTDMLSNSASLHSPLPGGGWSRGVFGVPLRGEGGLVSTVDDMLQWLRHMSDPVVGSHDSWQQMRTACSTHGYGFGLFMQKHRGLDTVHHAGAVAGGSSQALKVVDYDLDIVVLNNNGLNVLAMYQLVDAIIDACVPGLPPIPADSGATPLGGTFYSKATGRVMALIPHEGAQLVNLSGMMLPTNRDSDGGITVQIVPTDLVIRPDTEGSRLEVREFGSDDILDRIEPSPGESLDEWVGDYSIVPGKISAALSRSGDGFQLSLVNGLGSLTYPLVPLGPRLWQMVSPVPMPLGGTLEFEEGAFLFSTASTTRLRFHRS